MQGDVDVEDSLDRDVVCMNPLNPMPANYLFALSDVLMAEGIVGQIVSSKSV